MFWSSVELTGNQTVSEVTSTDLAFWSSVELTGNQTSDRKQRPVASFGAVSN